MVSMVNNKISLDHSTVLWTRFEIVLEGFEIVLEGSNIFEKRIGLGYSRG
jgi:hypothetical protein